MLNLCNTFKKPVFIKKKQAYSEFRDTQREYSSKPLKHSIVKRILVLYRHLLIVLPMRESSIFRGIAVSLLRPVIGSNVEIDVVALTIGLLTYANKYVSQVERIEILIRCGLISLQ